jgi:methylated-DNA-[protein]-cysteine S-methyltransferase
MTSAPNEHFCTFIVMDVSETIYYDSPVGILRITGEAGAITELHFMDAAKAKGLDRNVLDRKPVSPILQQCVAQLDNYFSGTSLQFDLKLAQEGTSFQQKVWAALLEIPYGHTWSYLQLSKKLGNVKAIRAAGTANGKNSIAIIVPCHRVIGSNGSLVGYAGELWRKQWLLEHEAKHAHGVQLLF